ncbi:MAG: tetratricopeptide repeat protein, partial [Candidatus Glassbacteria bacterium]|nr:tetratricopeptide repeat protein [Candidatus Glassbacteria bacterium]
PDSIVPRMMDSLNVSIFTKGTLSQPGGKGTELSAKVDFIYPKNEFTIEGDEYSVSDEKMTEELAKKVSQKIILASEKISYMSIARDYYNSSIYRKAIEYYEKFLQLEPNSINALYLIATSYLKMDSVDVAIQRYEDILANVDPDHIPTRDILAKTYFGRENYEKALEHYKILAEKKPEVYEYTQYEAYCLIKLERNEEALAAFRHLIKIRDDDPGIRTQMGFLRYTKANELEQSGDSAAAREQALNAVGHFHRSVELYRSSTDPEEIIRKFSASGQQENLEQVRSAGQKVRAALENLEMDQEKLSAAKQELELALKDMDLRKIEEAGQKIKAALGNLEGIELKMDPAEEKRMLDALNLAALADIKAGNNAKALEDFKALVEIDPAYPNAYYYMAVKANELNRFDEALSYCQEALKYVPENMQYSLYSIMGRIYYREKKDFSKAVDAYTRALPLAPADRKVIVLLFRGLSYYDLAQQTDYSNDENVDMDLLIDEEKMTTRRADQALVYYDKALDDLGKVTGRYAKSAQAHVNNIAQLKKRLDKIKQQIAYFEKTK